MLAKRVLQHRLEGILPARSQQRLGGFLVFALNEQLHDALPRRLVRRLRFEERPPSREPERYRHFRAHKRYYAHACLELLEEERQIDRVVGE
jgi:hypothetical protein